VCGAVALQRTHADAVLGDLGGLLEPAGSKRRLDLAQGGKMVAHVGEHVFAHRCWHRDRLTGVGREHCERQGEGGEGDDNTHTG